MNDEQFLMAVRSYIETSAATMDSIVMPPVYAEVLRRLQKPSPLVEWLEGDFKHACVHDLLRLKEAMWMLKVGYEKGDPPEQIMARAIACFVKGLIEKTQPLTAPVENN
jgi:hypothetical protein